MIRYKCRTIELSDEQWERIRSHFPEEPVPDGRPGRKPLPTRRVLEAILWTLNTGAQWHMLPQNYPNYKRVHRRFQAWCRDEVLRRVVMDVANELGEKGMLDEEERFKALEKSKMNLGLAFSGSAICSCLNLPLRVSVSLTETDSAQNPAHLRKQVSSLALLNN